MRLTAAAAAAAAAEVRSPVAVTPFCGLAGGSATGAAAAVSRHRGKSRATAFSLPPKHCGAVLCDSGESCIRTVEIHD